MIENNQFWTYLPLETQISSLKVYQVYLLMEKKMNFL